MRQQRGNQVAPPPDRDAVDGILSELDEYAVEEALKISNKNVADELGGLPPVKMHCSVLAEQGIAAAMIDFFGRNPQLTPPDGLMEKAKRLEELDPHGWPEEGEGE